MHAACFFSFSSYTHRFTYFFVTRIRRLRISRLNTMASGDFKELPVVIRHSRIVVSRNVHLVNGSHGRISRFLRRGRLVIGCVPFMGGEFYVKYGNERYRIMLLRLFDRLRLEKLRNYFLSQSHVNLSNSKNIFWASRN